MKNLKLLYLVAFAGANAAQDAVVKVIDKSVEQSIKSKIGVHVNVGGGYATHKFDQPFTAKINAENIKEMVLNEKILTSSDRIHSPFGLISAQGSYDMGSGFYAGVTVGMNYLIASNDIKHAGTSMDEIDKISKSLSEDKDYKQTETIKERATNAIEKGFGFTVDADKNIMKGHLDQLKDRKFSISHGPMIFVGAMAGKAINDQIIVEGGVNFTMRSLEGVKTVGQTEEKIKYDMSLGIMPSIKVKYAFHNRVGAFVEGGFNFALSDKVQQDGKDVVGLAMGHTFIVSVGVSAKVM